MKSSYMVIPLYKVKKTLLRSFMLYCNNEHNIGPVEGYVKRFVAPQHIYFLAVYLIVF